MHPKPPPSLNAGATTIKTRRTPIPAGRVAELCHELMLLGTEAAFLLNPENVQASDANEARIREIVDELRALGIKDENIPCLPTD